MIDGWGMVDGIVVGILATVAVVAAWSERERAPRRSSGWDASGWYDGEPVSHVRLVEDASGHGIVPGAPPYDQDADR
jgi:hypothetical protein